MAVTVQDLIAALEGSFFIYPEIPGKTTLLSVPGIEGHSTPISHPEANMVGLARLTAENAGDTIEQVKDIFRREKKSVGWLVGPNSTPPDLASRLIEAKFTLALEEAGMVLTDLAGTIPVNPGIRVEQVTEEGCRQAVPMIARASNMSEETARYIVDFFAALGARLEVSTYLAYPDGCDEPVAYATAIYLLDKPVVILQGAATLAEHRGQGIYSTLVARRLQDARARGTEAAIVQAIRSTSAPIVEKLGFSEVCALELYAWDPESGVGVARPRITEG